MSFQYYNPHEFHDNHYINEYFSDKCFSALHCNIKSLSANLDNLEHMFSDLYLPFSIVGLAEIKLKVDQSFFYPILKYQDIHLAFNPVFQMLEELTFILGRINYLQPHLILHYQLMILRLCG